MLGRIDGDVAVRSRDLWLDGCDAVIVRGIPRGSLEQVIFRVDALHALVERLPASASSDYGEPFGKVLADAEFDFYKIDPLLFSPAQIRLTSLASGRSFEAGRVDLEVLERSFWG